MPPTKGYARWKISPAQSVRSKRRKNKSTEELNITINRGGIRCCVCQPRPSVRAGFLFGRLDDSQSPTSLVVPCPTAISDVVGWRHSDILYAARNHYARRWHRTLFQLSVSRVSTPSASVPRFAINRNEERQFFRKETFDDDDDEWLLFRQSNRPVFDERWCWGGW